MSTKNLVPNNTGEGQIGTTNIKWDKAIFVSGSFETLEVNGQQVTGASGGGEANLNNLDAAVINVANDSFAFIDADDSNSSKKESISDFVSSIAGSGLNASNGQLSVASSGGNPDFIEEGDTRVETIDTGSDGHIIFKTENVERWHVESGGHLIPQANATYDIGEAENKVRHFYLSDNSLRFSSGTVAGEDLKIYRFGRSGDDLQWNIYTSTDGTTLSVNPLSSNLLATRDWVTTNHSDVDVSKTNLITRLGELNENDTLNIGDAGNDTSVVIKGNLTVSGTTTTVNTETINLADNIITLNSNYVGNSPTENAGIEVERGDLTNKQLIWDEGNDKWTIGNETLEAVINEIQVTVVSDGGNKFSLDGATQKSASLVKGFKYKFDQSDSSNSTHPLRFSTTSDGTHGGGVEYTTGVTTSGTPGSAGAYTVLDLTQNSPDLLYYYCSSHSGMGASVKNNPYYTDEDVRLYEESTNGTNYISIKSPASLANNYTLTLPADDGDADQVLKTDGSGTLSWVDQGGGGGGGSLPSVTEISAASYTITITPGAIEQVYLCGTNSSAITLPTAVGNTGFKIQIKNIITSAVVVSAATNETIDGVSTATLVSQYDALTFISNGTNWFII